MKKNLTKNIEIDERDIVINESEFRYIARALSSYDMFNTKQRIGAYMETFVDMKRRHQRYALDSLQVGSLASTEAEGKAFEDVIVAVLVGTMFALKNGQAQLEHEMERACCKARKATKAKEANDANV